MGKSIKYLNTEYTGVRLEDVDKKAAHDLFGENKEKYKQEINLERLFENL